MAGGTLGQFMAAIRQQESGGNYRAHNPSGAEGAYQILESNIPSWSKKTFGHSISLDEFLSHPAEQDAIARHIMAPGFKKYGPEGEAAVWYSGQPDPTKTYGNPPVYKYVASVMSLMGKSGSVQVDDVSGSSVTTAGLQQAGYDAVIDVTPFGIPLNPFKLPGWLAGQFGGGSSDSGGVGGALGGVMWDAIGPIVLSALAVAGGLGLVLLGLYVTAKPAADAKKQELLEAASAAPIPV